MGSQPISEPIEYWFYGWKEFRRNRADVLAEYDRSKQYNVSRPMQTEHGVAGEAAFRRWLSDFLPKKYGITSGYVIPYLVVADYKLRHFDLIIYDVLSSPILRIDGDYDKTDQGKKRAIPARYVHSVLEIKAGLTRRSAEDGIKKLGELNALAGHLQPLFSSGLVVFELDVGSADSFDIVQALLPSEFIMGYWGWISPALRTRSRNVSDFSDPCTVAEQGGSQERRYLDCQGSADNRSRRRRLGKSRYH
jgi:hypothetical protein